MCTGRYAQVTPPPALFIWSRVADFHDKVRKVSALSEVADLLGAPCVPKQVCGFNIRGVICYSI